MSESGSPGSAGGGEGLWEGRTGAELALTWKLPRVDLHQVVGSTNDVARGLAGEGAADGTLVLADEQTAGRGRSGRSWSSPPGLGLWFSMVRVSPAPELLATIPLQVALEVAGALQKWSRAPVLVKWPNDLVADGRKIGGILCESVWEGSRPRYLIVGVGLNLLHEMADFPVELRSSATSLRTVGARPFGRLDVATPVISAVRRCLLSDAHYPEDALSVRFRRKDALVGRLVEVTEPATGRRLMNGIARGIDAEGSLLVESDGTMHPVRSGTIRLMEG